MNYLPCVYFLLFTSVSIAMYKEHMDDESFIWPWERTTTEETETVTYTSLSPEQAASEEDFWSGFTMAEKIGIGIGIAGLCLLVVLLIGVLMYCFCRSMNNDNQKVTPTSSALPKNKVYSGRRVSYSRDVHHYHPGRGVYIIPDTYYPPPYDPAPVSRYTPRDKPPPYSEARYGPSLGQVREDEDNENLPVQISWPEHDATPVRSPNRYSLY